jgi:hypothetical protein
MKQQSKRGGKRPGSGLKVNIPAKIIALAVALKLDIGLYQAREQIKGWSPEV